ncbi:DUF2460 domain-containing protein [Parvularcula maris]|uniref:DUF2460 domain-containing protein n=1 Tax=Parvularcula maris TaxID=2965077 RepID=A0A9X2L736_9PROT|nr:DUF2460 domain-containing protein [Parvularcula maris]MCQ8184242.1 DUF2460 domain-containing protein [Parvularcula maris]
MGRESFRDVAFPEEIAIGARGGPSRHTDIASLASGAEVRRARWTGSRRSWQIALPSLEAAEAARLTAFFEACGGRRLSFPFRDPFDHATAEGGADISANDVSLGVGDGSRTVFPLIKTYDEYERPIGLCVEGSLRIAVDGGELSTGFALSTERDAVIFDTPPTDGVAVTGGFLFDTPARFASDDLVLQLGARGASVPSLELVEVLL